MKLYEISQSLLPVIDEYQNAETQEQLDALEYKLHDIQVSFNEKALSCAHYIINEESDITAITNEIERLEKIKTIKVNRNKWLKNYLKNQMDATNTTKIDSPTCKLSIQNNPKSVVIDNEDLIPEQYKRTKVIKEVNKIAIKEAWENQIGVEGTHIETKTRLVIK